MKWLLNQKISFVGGSPTNKAVKNLNKLAAEAKISIEAHTVARLLGQQPELNEETGKEEFITKGTDSIGGYQVALIDEFSMISKSNFKDINQAVWHTPTKVIFVGDAARSAKGADRRLRRLAAKQRTTCGRIRTNCCYP